jgi:uncharacterized protein (DUF302 family)
MKYAFGVEIDLPFEAAVEKTIAAITAEKLGIVSDVDAGAILKAKLGEDIGGYRILGACAPGLAKRVIAAEPAAGALLPCNVVVRRVSDTRTAVDFLDPEAILSMTEAPEVSAVAAEARAILGRVVESLRAS